MLVVGVSMQWFEASTFLRQVWYMIQHHNLLIILAHCDGVWGGGSGVIVQLHAFCAWLSRIWPFVGAVFKEGVMVNMGC